MKTIRTPLLCATLVLFSLFASAQNDKPPVTEPDYNKPRLFDDLPARIPVSTADLKSIISASAGQQASLTLSPASALPFDGQVVSVASKYNNKIKSTVVRSANFKGATFTLSRVVNDNGSTYFTGRIINFKYGDLYELKNEDGNYVLIKRNYYELVNE